MFKAVLFDLDGTLLPLDLDIFVKNYFASVGKYFGDKVNPEVLVKYLGKGLKGMLSNPGEISNQEIFMDIFLKGIEKDKEEMYPLFDKYYLEEFPNLKEHTNFSSLSRKIIGQVVEKGYPIVLATNPVFPRQATLHRMEWAGIKDMPWKLVTTYEKSFTCKPNPEYFKYVCNEVNVKPEECLMVGNDMQEDLPASDLGMKTFLVKDYLIDRGSPKYKPDYEGSLEDLYKFVCDLPKANK